MNVIERIKQDKIVAVIRTNDKKSALKVADACILGGINLIEITYTIPDAGDVIASIHKKQYKDIVLGAGTVIHQSMCEEAIRAGAQFIVSPVFDAKISDICQQEKIPYIPGCMTVTEIFNAFNAGSKIIKLFPANQFNPSYIKSIKGPLPNVEIMPTGGINLDNIKSWFKHGATAVGVGSALTKLDKSNKYESITHAAKAYKNIVSEVISWQK